jgi:hypothetical protein
MVTSSILVLKRRLKRDIDPYEAILLYNNKSSDSVSKAGRMYKPLLDGDFKKLIF